MIFLLYRSGQLLCRLVIWICILGIYLQGSGLALRGLWHFHGSLCLRRLLAPGIDLVNIVEQNLTGANIAFIAWFDRIVDVIQPLLININTLTPMAAKCTFGGFFWNQCVFIRVSFDVKVDLAFVFMESRFLHGRFLLQHLSNVGGVPEARVFHQLVIFLVVEIMLPDSMTMELVLRVSRCELKAIARVLELACKNRTLPILDLLVKTWSCLEIRVPLERVRSFKHW